MDRSSRWCEGMAAPATVPVVLSIFLMACAQVGTIKSIGIYLEDISRSLGTTPTDIGVALGLFAAFSYFPAPLIITLYRMRWVRRGILITGSMFIPLGVIMTSFATNNVVIAIYLAIAGLGHCMLTVCSTLTLDQLADGRRFNFLYGLGMSGFGLGMVLLPYAADVLGRTYGWRGGLLILGGIMMNTVPCALAIQVGDTSLVRNGTQDGSAEVSGESAPSVTGYPKVSEFTDKDSHFGIEQYQGSQKCPDEKPPKLSGVDTYFLHHSTDDGLADVPGKSGTSDGRFSEIPENIKDCATPILDKAYPCGITLDQHYQKCLDEKTSNPRLTSQENELSCSRYFDEVFARFRRTDFYTDPIFNCMFGSNLTFGIVYCGWHAFLVPHALQRGYSVHSTIIMTLFASLGNFIGRLFAGVLSYRLTEPIILYLCAAIVNAFAILCDVLFHHYYVMTVSACVTAINIAGMAVLGPLSIRNRSSPEFFDVAYAASESFFGFGTFLGGYLSGLVGEIFSSYDATFQLLIGADVLAFLFMLLPFIFKKP